MSDVELHGGAPARRVGARSGDRRDESSRVAPDAPSRRSPVFRSADAVRDRLRDRRVTGVTAGRAARGACDVVVRAASADLAAACRRGAGAAPARPRARLPARRWPAGARRRPARRCPTARAAAGRGRGAAAPARGRRRRRRGTWPPRSRRRCAARRSAATCRAVVVDVATGDVLRRPTATSRPRCRRRTLKTADRRRPSLRALGPDARLAHDGRRGRHGPARSCSSAAVTPLLARDAGARRRAPAGQAAGPRASPTLAARHRRRAARRGGRRRCTLRVRRLAVRRARGSRPAGRPPTSPAAWSSPVIGADGRRGPGRRRLRRAAPPTRRSPPARPSPPRLRGRRDHASPDRSTRGTAPPRAAERRPRCRARRWPSSSSGCSTTATTTLAEALAHLAGVAAGEAGELRGRRPRRRGGARGAGRPGAGRRGRRRQRAVAARPACPRGDHRRRSLRPRHRRPRSARRRALCPTPAACRSRASPARSPTGSTRPAAGRGRGVVRAKTGTLTGVVGARRASSRPRRRGCCVFVVRRRPGRRGPRSTPRRALDRAAAALAVRLTA